MDRIKHIQTFTGGMNTVLAPKLLPADTYEYMLNCNVFSSAEGNMGAVTNTRGNTEVLFDLPAGNNKCIGCTADEEKNNLYFFIYNSSKYHGIYRYNLVDNAVVKIMQCMTDTAGIDIFQWEERDLILQSNVIGNNLLYWCVRGEKRHPARKINIAKAMDRTETGYNGVIREEYTRAYKRTATYPPRAEYFTDTDRKYNRVYGRLFKFATRYVYDDGELSNWSSFSTVPTPDFERFSGSLAVPLENNGINVYINTGGFLVKKIEIAMMSTNTEGGTLPWVSIESIDKDKLGLGDFSEYTYSFYNDSSTEAIGDQAKIYRPYSYLPKDPRCQEFTNNAIVYANFHEGFPSVPVDVNASVRYEDLFIPSEEEPELNSPSITVINTSTDWRSDGALFGSGWRALEGTLVIGPDVKKGNNFAFSLYDSKKGTRYTQSILAGITDNAKTIATKFANKFRENLASSSNPQSAFEFVTEVQTDVSGNAFFSWKYWNSKGDPHLGWATYVNPVNTTSLKNAGQSVQNIKLGSSVGYAISYFDEDGRKSAAYRDYDMTVAIASINELGGLKKPIVSLTINHVPPSWAAYYQIVRTDDLVYGNYIQMLIQKTVQYSDGSDEYIDLVVGSLFTYQRMHPNSTLQYEFRKGDRVRLVKQHDGDDWVIPSESRDFEILGYFPTTEEVKDEDIEVDGTSTVKVSTASTDHIGSFIRVNGAEREIIDAPDATSYTLNEPLSSGDPANETKKFPSYTIINYRGILRIKSDPDNPIQADPTNDIYPLVEVYSPSIGDTSVDEDLYSEFGQVYPIIGFGTDTPYHGGSVQDQSASQPAIVEISAGTSYVRYRELPINNDPENPQVLVSEVEDKSYSDFYVSDMNDNGKRIPLDRGDGEVLFDERMRFSNNYIQGTRINGLNDFDNLDRQDYNDKYGAIELTIYEEGRMYVFKHLKDAWLPVYGSIITDQSGSSLLAQSDKLLADKLQYFAWDGGVGDNPESVARLGTQFFHVSPNSMIVARIGGNGVDAISKIYGIDKTVQAHLSSAKKAGAHIYGGADTHNEKYDVSIEPHDNVISDTPISEAGWDNDVAPLPSSGITYSIVTPPAHGTATLNGDVIDYEPDSGYNGPDTFSYEVFDEGESLGIRNVCLTVIYREGPKVWRPINAYCVTDMGAKTGYKGWSTLEEYDTFNNQATGVTKPNVQSDPDYVADVYDPVYCTPEEQKLFFTTNSTGVNTNLSVWLNEWSGTVAGTISFVVIKGGIILNEQIIPTGGIEPVLMDLVESDVNVYVRAAEETFGLIKEVRIRDFDWGIDSIYPSIFAAVEKLNVANQKSLVSVDLSNNISVNRLEMYNNGLTGNVDISMLSSAVSVELFNNNITSISSVTNHPLITYYNVSENGGLTSFLDFTNSPDIHTILAFACDLSGIDISGRTNLFEVGISQNLNMTQSIDLNSCPNIEVFTAEQVPLTNVTWDLLSKVRGFFVAANSIPQSSIQAGVNANKPVLEAVSIISMPQITAPLDFNNCPNLHFLWCTDLQNCTGISWNNSNSINNLSIVGMHALSHAIDITGKTVNEYLGVTGSNISPTNLDALIMYISSLNVPPLDFDRPNIPGPGTVLYGDYGTAIGTIHPTSASLSAYNDLISRGYTVVGPVPGT